jgi:hypothetical protein
MDGASSRKPRQKFYIAPSLFASHFHFGCERQLIFSAAHIDRAKWFYKDEETDEFIQFDRSTSVQLEIARQSGDKEAILLDGSRVDLNGRIHDCRGVKRTIIRSNWFYVPQKTREEGRSPQPRPLSEENCSKLDAGSFMADQPVEVKIDGIDFVARLDSMKLFKRHFEKDVPEEDKPLTLQKWNSLIDAERDALSLAFTSGGDLWESQILDILQADHHLVHMGELPPGAESRASDRKLSMIDFIKLLSSSSTTQSKGREFVYQPSLEAPAQLYANLKLNKSQVVFSKCFPDFLEISRKVGDKIEITIVDAKATDRMKLSHRIQVAIYYFIIDAILEANNLKERVTIKDIGGVWLRGKMDYETFELTPVVTYLREFFTEGKWKQLSETPLTQVSAQLSKKCGHCNFIDYCKSEARMRETELSLIYGITSYEKKYVKNFLEDQGHIQASEQEITPIEEIHRYLQSHVRDRIAPTSEDASAISLASDLPTSSGPGPATPIRAPKVSEARTPTSAPSTPNSSLATQEVDLMSPTKPEEPPSPFPTRTGSDFSVGMIDTLVADTQPFGDAPSAFIGSEKLEETVKGKPLNRNLWMSMMKMRSFLTKQPVLLHQPSTQLSEAEDIALVLNIVWDRPNGHVLGWSVTTRLSSAPAQKRQMDLFSALQSLRLPNVIISHILGNNTHISSFLNETLKAHDPKVTRLSESLIRVLYWLLSFIHTNLPKATAKLFVFTPTESENLCEILMPFAQNSVFRPYNSNVADFVLDAHRHQPEVLKHSSTANLTHDVATEVHDMALKLLTTLFQVPTSIALPHQSHLKNASAPCLASLRPIMHSLLALPLAFDADFDDFHRVLCEPIDLDQYQPPKELHSQKGILSQWYHIIKSNPDDQAVREGISDHFHSVLARRGAMVLDILNSIRSLVAGVNPPAIQYDASAVGGQFKPISSLENRDRLSLLVGKSKVFLWNSYIPSCDHAISKLLFANSFDMLGDAMKKMNDRLTIAFRESFQMEDRVVALKLRSTYQKQRPRSVVEVYVFEFDYMSESLMSALQQDILDPKTERWLLCSNSDKGVSSALEFDDYRHATPAIPGFKFVPPVELAFATPQEFSTSESGHGKRLLHLIVKRGKKMPPLVVGHTYYLSEFLVDLTSDILKTCLYALDLRIGFMRSLSKLKHPSAKVGEELIIEKQSVNRFLTWFLREAQVVPPKPAGKSFYAHPMDIEFFNRMGGLSAFFLEFASQTLDPESQPADLGPSQLKIEVNQGLPTLANPSELERAQDRVKLTFSALGGAMSSIGESLVWAIEEFQGIQRVGTAVPMALLEDPIGWGKATPGDFRDQTPEIARAQVLAELVVAHGQLTSAQHDIFEAVLRQKLTCVWGPPGTGKTYFLANLLLLLLESHRQMVMKEVVVTAEASKKRPSAKQAGKSTSAKKSASSASSVGDSATSSSETDSIKALVQDLQAGLNIAPTETPVEPVAAATPAPPQIVRQLVATGAPFCIMVVAFTHRAIDNLLDRFLVVNTRFREDFASAGSEIPNVGLPVGRMFSDKQGKTESTEIVDLHSEADLEDFMTVNPQCVIGTTVWALRKYAKPSTVVHMLVVDEASQLLLSQCIIASQWLLPSGRMVVVGDHEQLPPISNTVYPDHPSTASSTRFAASVFQYLQGRDRERANDPTHRSITQMLAENWRSNSVLSSIPSATIYASNDPKRHYHPATPAIANQKFWLQAVQEDQIPGLPTMFHWVPKPEMPVVPIAHPLLQLMFDANRPFGVVMLRQAAHGVSLDSFPQAPLIACLASAVRQASAMLHPKESDAQFWASKLLIVAPHHAQRHRIRDHLLNPGHLWHVDWNPNVNPAIETVEKAQGRQFTSVIVDYGIIDSFRISKELSFLYSRNRINVSQTRAESKCIFFISDTMLQMTPQIYNTRGIQEGFSYLQYILNWARKRGLVIDLATDEIPSTCRALENDPFFAHMQQLLPAHSSEPFPSDPIAKAPTASKTPARKPKVASAASIESTQSQTPSPSDPTAVPAAVPAPSAQSSSTSPSIPTSSHSSAGATSLNGTSPTAHLPL